MNKKMTPEELEQFIHRELRALPPRKAPAGFEARLQAAVEARAVSQAQSSEQLEQLVHRELRGLPGRRAPQTLEARVLAEIERRATIAWYHKSWSYWPAAVRTVFLVLGTAFAGAAVTAFYQLSQGAGASALSSAAGDRLSFFSKAYQVAVWVTDFTAHLIGSVPLAWLYGGGLVVVLMYATFFGLGATAYRSFVARAK